MHCTATGRATSVFMQLSREFFAPTRHGAISFLLKTKGNLLKVIGNDIYLIIIIGVSCQVGKAIDSLFHSAILKIEMRNILI